MSRLHTTQIIVLALAAVIMIGGSVSAQFMGSYPIDNDIDVSPGMRIEVAFVDSIQPGSIREETFLVHGSISGHISGSVWHDWENPEPLDYEVAYFYPASDYAPGEVVTVVLTEDIWTYDYGRIDPVVFSFTIGSDGGGPSIYEIDTSYAVGVNPYEVVAADFNADSYPDLAVSNRNSDNISVLLNDGTGQFPTMTNYAVLGDPHGLCAGDFNRDGYMDLVVAENTEDRISVLMNNGNGTFAPFTAYTVTGNPTDVVVIDINANGILDLATANSSSNNVSILDNDGEGHFYLLNSYSAGNQPVILTVADFNRDLRMDLACANLADHNVMILQNDGGHFSISSTLATANDPWGIFAADLDGNHWMDVVTANGVQQQVSVLMNQPSTGFDPYVTYASGGASASVIATDVNNDGDLDLLAGSTGSFNLSVMLNSGSGTFPTRTTYEIIGGPHGIAAADFDGDGDIDVAATDVDSNRVTILINKEIPAVVATAPGQNQLNVLTDTAISVEFSIPMLPTSINDTTFVVSGSISGPISGYHIYDEPSKTASFDPDSNFVIGEVVSVTLTTVLESSEGVHLDTAYTWSFRIGIGEGLDVFVIDSQYTLAQTVRQVIPAFFDYDGFPDIVAIRSDDTVNVFLNQGDGTYGEGIASPNGGATSQQSIAGDFTGNGVTDIMVSHSSGNGVRTMSGNGDGTFNYDSDCLLSSFPRDICKGDFDGDGDLDIAVALYTGFGSPDSIAILINSGTGVFSIDTSFAVPVGDNLYNIESGDFTNDGVLDLAAVVHDNAFLTIFKGDGSGDFNMSDSIFEVGARPWDVTTGDMDGDGNLDIICASSSGLGIPSSVSVLLNSGNGNGYFQDKNDYYAGGDSTYTIALGDLNADGYLDVITGHMWLDSAWILLNNGDGSLGTPQIIELPEPYNLAIVDVSGDGRLDLLSCGGNDLTVMFGATTPNVVSTSPDQNELDVLSGTSISVEFNTDIDTTTISSSTFLVSGSMTGLRTGSYSYNAATKTSTFDPDDDFAVGEEVTVIVTTEVQASEGLFLESAFVWTFTCEVPSGGASFLVSAPIYDDRKAVSPAAGDFDGDGDIDLAMSGGDQDSIYIWENDGTGSYSLTSVTYLSTGSEASDLAVADFNNDNDLDLVVAGYSPHGFTILNGNGGNSSFTEGTFYPDISSGVNCVCPADFNADGWMDVAVGVYVQGLDIYLNDGTGELFVASEMGTSSEYSVDLVAADFDEDGFMDFAEVCSNEDDSMVWVHIGVGDGTFAASVPYDGARKPLAIVAADFNNDGHVDIASHGSYSILAENDFAVIFGDGQGHFSAKTTLPVPSHTAMLMGTGDIDGDGDLDIVTVRNRISLYVNDGEGVFTFDSSLVPPIFGFASQGYNDLVLADLTDNGQLDLAFCGINEFSVLPGVIGDADGDGILDDGDGSGVAGDNPCSGGNTSNCDDNCPYVYNPGQEDSDIDGIGDACDVSYDITTEDSAQMYDMVTFDLDRDTYKDVIHVGTTIPGLFISWGLPGGTLEPPVDYLSITEADLEIGFFNNDTLPDIMATKQDTVFFLLNDDNRQFTPDTTLLPGVPKGRSVVPVSALGYFNGDDFNDLFVGPDIVFYGDGTGSLGDAHIVSLTAIAAEAVDFNADGFDDLLIIEDDSAKVMINNKVGDFDRASAMFVGFPTLVVPPANGVADISHDGRWDIVVVVPDVDGAGQSVVKVALGDGYGGMNRTDSLLIPGVAHHVSLADINRDQQLDIMVVDGTNQELLLFWGDGSGTFTGPDVIPFDPESGITYALATADLDRDGQPDFVSGAVDEGVIILGYSELPDEDILEDEMVITGYSVVTLTMTNPLGYELSLNFQTLAGGDAWQVDVDQDGTLDEQLVDYNLMLGEYSIGINLEPGADPYGDHVVSGGIRINGSQELIIFDNYNDDMVKKATELESNEPWITFYYTVEEVSSMTPPNGMAINTNLPGFAWHRLIDPTGIEKYHFQLDPYYDFRSPLYDIDTITNLYYIPESSLGSDSVFYWRVRSFDGSEWSYWSRTFAAYIAGTGCCEGLRGNVDNIGEVNIADLTYLVAYLFTGGPPPPCSPESNVDGITSESGGEIDIADLTYLVSYLFTGGGAPDGCW
ncbi:MAG: VCBS repeat-containing protein [candidate division Zixibacteria bacterium]|nr:VCBS repeat-containing protein [candidate division Zixibacteria bacterium]